MSPQKAILFVATAGSHIYHFMLPFMQMMADRGYAVDVLTSKDHTHHKLMASSCIRSFYPLDLSRNPLHIKNIRAYRYMKRLLQKNAYSIIHTNSPVSSFYIRLAARKLTDTKMIYMAHGFHFFRGAPLKNWLLYFPAEWLASHFTNEIITINHEDYLVAKRHFKSCPVHYVQGTGLDLDTYHAAPKEEDAPLTLLCVGEFTKRKNHKQIIKALPLITDMIEDARIWFVGIGPQFTPCKELARELGVLDHTYWLGFRYDVPELLNQADVVVLASYHEGVPRCLLEAMACKKPIVATDARGSRELVADGENGYLVKCDDVEGFAKACVRVLNADMEAMGQKSYEMVQPYDVSIVKERILKIYGVAP